MYSAVTVAVIISVFLLFAWRNICCECNAWTVAMNHKHLCNVWFIDFIVMFLVIKV